MRRVSLKEMKEKRFQFGIKTIMIILLILSFIPMILMIMMSFKSTLEMYNNFFGLPRHIEFSNYEAAVSFLGGNMINSIAMVFVSVVLTLIFSGIGGYVFAVKEFPGKNILYTLLLMLMMIPSILSLASNYNLIIDYGLLNTRWAVILHWVASGQVMGVILCRNSIEGMPRELFDAAKIDGCTDVKMLVKVVVPLIKPILSTVAVLKAVEYYNDFIWPMMVIESNNKQLITVVLRVFTSSQDVTQIGVMFAGYVIATIPLFILFMFTSRLYMEGLTAGAIKG